MFSEQLRLILTGVRESIVVGMLLSCMLLWALYRPADNLLLVIWFVTFVVIRLSGVMYSHHMLRHCFIGWDDSYLKSIQRTLVLNKILEGLSWGALVWISFDSATLAERILLISLMAAISGNAVSLLSPIIAVYLSLVLPMLVLVATKLWLEGDSAYLVLAGACPLYVGAQFGQARTYRRSLRESIALRFQNLGLIANLKSESETAAQARDEAEEANLAKSKFLAAASHDLRQPIHALGLFLEVLSRGNLTPCQRQVLDNASAAALASAEMLNTLLDFSRIEAGVIEARFRDCQLQPLLNKLENELAPQADSKGLIYRCRETRLMVRSDAALLELILRNLISNAIRYTDIGGILIACRRRGGEVLIEIYDTGIGIEPAQQLNIFREFYQLGNPERDRRKGLGLGLAITDGLIRSLGHQLSLSSRLGRGSRFRVIAPLVDPLVSGSLAAVDEPSQQLDIDDQQLSGKYMLVIDDDEAVRQGMYLLLKGWGCECFTVETLDQAKQLGTQTPDAIICDYRLREGFSGGDVIRLLRDYYEHDVPALLVTGDTAPERLREATATGIPLLYKPLSPLLLRKTLVGLFG
ncbi:ATP-binding response regulator [Pseudomonas sp. NPDC086278]|uniref:ATP-binding response regulator n=1 Tax=Pseudomonas sp. NPDC086278 TaxID=3390646 RepID=UPI003D060545